MSYEAKSVVAHAAYLLERAIVVDTETTGLGNDDQVIELAAVHAATGEVLVNTLVHTSREISEEAQQVHGISTAEVAEHGAHVADVVRELLGHVGHDACLLAFNSFFDQRLIIQSLRACSGLPALMANSLVEDVRAEFSACAMELANRYFAPRLEWNAEYSCFKRLSLARCMELAGLEFRGPSHRALVDALATRDLLAFIANDGANYV